LKSGVHPESHYRELWETITAGRVWQGKFHNKRKDGTLYWEHATIAPVYDSAGRMTHFIAVKEDITARARAEESLRQANLVVENSPAVLFRWKAAEGWPVEFVSENVAQFGYTPEELCSGEVPYASIVHPDDRERVAHEVQEYSAGGVKHFRQEYRIVTRAGQVRWIDDRTMVERDAAGNITHYQGIILDITVRKQAEIAMRRYTDEQAALYAVSSAVSASMDPGILLSSTIDVVLPLLDSDAGWVTLPGLTPDDPPHIVVHRGISASFLEAEESLPLRDCPVCMPLLASGEVQSEPMLCTDCPRLPPEIHDESGLHSHIGIPLSAGGKVLGILNVGWRAPRPFSESNRALLTTIGGQMGLALHNAQLYQAARQVDRLRVLNKLDRALAATLDPDAVVEITLRQLAAAVDTPMNTLLNIPLQADAAVMRAFSVGRG